MQSASKACRKFSPDMLIVDMACPWDKHISAYKQLQITILLTSNNITIEWAEVQVHCRWVLIMMSVKLTGVISYILGLYLYSFYINVNSEMKEIID